MVSIPPDVWKPPGPVPGGNLSPSHRLMTGYDKKLTRAAQTRHLNDSETVQYTMYGKTWLFTRDYVRVVFNRVRPSRSHVLEADSPDGKWYHCKVVANFDPKRHKELAEERSRPKGGPGLLEILTR